jgi:hypothetical protein
MGLVFPDAPLAPEMELRVAQKLPSKRIVKKRV